MSVPAVSVLMPVYNTQAYLAEAVESILNQTFRDFEFIIIDDGSTDRSLEILRRYEQQDSRIRLTSRGNRGLIKTRNELLREAKGELVAWADSDDISYADRLEKQSHCLVSDSDVVWVGGAVELVDPNGCPICVMGDPHNNGLCVTAMRRSVALRLGGFREQFQIAEDTDLQLRMEESGRAIYLDRPLIRYRQHAGSICFTKRASVEAYKGLAIELAAQRRSIGSDALQLGKSVSLPPVQKHRPESVHKTYGRWAWWALGAGNVVTARKYAVKVAVQRPFSLKTWRLVACALRGR